MLETDSILLPCSAIGFPPPEFEWIKFLPGMPQPLDVNSSRKSSSILFRRSHNSLSHKHTPLFSIPSARYSLPPSGTGNGSLIILSAQQDDSATLQCTATNEAGSVTTPAIQIIVIGNNNFVYCEYTRVYNRLIKKLSLLQAHPLLSKPLIQRSVSLRVRQ